ncbi:MAG: AAA family ATPase [Deltaproteobacteria bacterium]|nr:AAA family ATPase [Deltaproteobacteria bacterium]
MRSDQLLFPPFRLDVANEGLWRGTQQVSLRRKTFAVLRYLVEHAHRLVTKEELLAAVWPGIYVGEKGPRVCIREIRQALEDDAAAPQFIETVHGRGYRFLPSITTQPVPSAKLQVASTAFSPASSPQHLAPPLVGRETELAQLHGWLEKALNGERQIIFVTGEPGIGKTTVVETFLDRVAAAGSLWTARGQCVEHYGAGEPYLPMLDALERLCRTEGNEVVYQVLERYAPTWLVRLPWLLSETHQNSIQREEKEATRERMLREMAVALEALTVKAPLVLNLEDLQWSDYSTLELLSFLAQRRDPARLLLVATCRSLEGLESGHPLKTIVQELQLRRRCEELPLDFLTEAEVSAYLAARFPESDLRELARVIYRRTDGNALFMVNMVDYLLAQGLLVAVNGQWQLRGGIETVEVGVPKSLRRLIEQQLERLSPEEQQVLEVGSVTGMEFSAAAVAAGLEAEEEEIEERCEGLARRGQFLRSQGLREWPDGTAAAHYSFIHSVYQDVLYDRITVARRSRWHRQIGEREEQAYGSRAWEIAAELAMHFERGRDSQRAVQYFAQAAEKATRQYANQEAVGHLTKGLELLKALPDIPERAWQELTLQIALGASLVTLHGWPAPAVGATYTRALELCQQLRETLLRPLVLRGLCGFYDTRAEYQTARALEEQLLHLAQDAQDPTMLIEAHYVLGFTLFWLGEFDAAREHVEQGLTLYSLQPHDSSPLFYGRDPGVSCKNLLALILWHLGYPDQALAQSHQALALAQERAYPFSMAWALDVAALLHALRREDQVAQERAEAAIALCTEQGSALFSAWGTVLRELALAERGQEKRELSQVRQSLAAYQSTGAEFARTSFLALLAKAYEEVGQVEEGLTVVGEALATVHRTGERAYEAELYRLQGELFLKQKVHGFKSKARLYSEAEMCFQRAMATARQQQAKTLELQAVTSLSRLYQRQGKNAEARRMLTEIYSWFTEGFDTAALKEARVLLQEL